MKPLYHSVGTRVTRPIFMDDGTWASLGDSCLKRSPLRRGIVRKVGFVNGDYVHLVDWEDGKREDGYLYHGLDVEHG